MKNLFTLLSLAAVAVAANAETPVSNDQPKKSDRVAIRRTVVEEGTGTGCGWCPRGLVGMQIMKETLGDRFIGIGLHQYNSSDPMYISSYNVSFSGFPSCKVDRGADTDPYYGNGNNARGILDVFETANAKEAPVDVELTATWAEGTDFESTDLKVDLTASIYAIEADKYKLEFVITADSLIGTTNAWKQSNYYTQYNASQVDEDLQQFAKNGEYGQSSFFWAFDDVALATSKNKSEQPGDMEVDEEKEISYTLALPTKAKLLDAVKASIDKVYGIAIVVDSKKKIANAIRVKVVDPNTIGIKTVENEVAAQPAASYSIDGKQVSANQKGFSIIRMSDGTVRKVFRQ